MAAKLNSNVRKRYKKTLRELGYNTCMYCGSQLIDLQELPQIVKQIPDNATTVDHIVPRSRGGDNSLQNMVLCCHKCNGRKSSQNHIDFMAKVQSEKFIERIINIFKFFAKIRFFILNQKVNRYFKQQDRYYASLKNGKAKVVAQNSES